MKRMKWCILPALLWAILAAFAWILPSEAVSEAERRPLAQMPEMTAESLLSGEFMEKFEDYSLDQFPLRDAFRRIKSLFHFYILQQEDNNDIYLSDGYAVKQEYPLKEDSVVHALDRFQYVYEKYLADSNCAVYQAVIPDKGYYLAETSGHLTMDYEKLFSMVKTGMPWATPIDLTEDLSAEDYYETDVHWRQEKLLSAAQIVCDAMGIMTPDASDYRTEALQRPFYGVYYGQAALPMEPETLYYLQSDLLQDCRVYDYESGQYTDVYNMEKLNSRDLYDVFLSGSRSLLTIENPYSQTGRELILFRDSFGSSLAPLLVQGYDQITLVDIRYIQIDVLDRFLEFRGQDVLFLYSTSILNNSQTIK